MKRLKIYENIFSAGVLFIAGLLILPSVLFNLHTGYRVLQFLFFWFLVWLSGRKSSPVFTLLAIAGIAAFNLIVPYGRVLFSAGLLKITSGALKAGIHRAVTFEALVMISKLSIRQDLKIPGAFGGLLGESLRIFSVMMSMKFRLTGKNIFVEIDNLLLELSGGEFAAPEVAAQRTKPAGFLAIAVVVLVSWFLCIAGYLT